MSTIVPAGYLDAGQLDHGYAITGHRAQGLAVDRTWIQTSDTLHREWGYVAASRGCRHNQLYATGGTRPFDADDLDHGAWQSSDSTVRNDWPRNSAAPMRRLQPSTKSLSPCPITPNPVRADRTHSEASQVERALGVD